MASYQDEFRRILDEVISASNVYGHYPKQAKAAADALVVELERSSYKEFALLNLLDEVDDELSEYVIGGPDFAEEIVSHIRRACHRVGGYSLIGPEELAYFNSLPDE